jgi:hypothetical protein
MEPTPENFAKVKEILRSGNFKLDTEGTTSPGSSTAAVPSNREKELEEQLQLRDQALTRANRAAQWGKHVIGRQGQRLGQLEARLASTQAGDSDGSPSGGDGFSAEASHFEPDENERVAAEMDEYFARHPDAIPFEKDLLEMARSSDPEAKGRIVTAFGSTKMDVVATLENLSILREARLARVAASKTADVVDKMKKVQQTQAAQGDPLGARGSAPLTDGFSAMFADEDSMYADPEKSMKALRGVLAASGQLDLKDPPGSGR